MHDNFLGQQPVGLQGSISARFGLEFLFAIQAVLGLALWKPIQDEILRSTKNTSRIWYARIKSSDGSLGYLFIAMGGKAKNQRKHVILRRGSTILQIDPSASSTNATPQPWPTDY